MAHENKIPIELCEDIALFPNVVKAIFTWQNITNEKDAASS